jgi:maltose alpha-D-glucosyltransferase/alpha-amylase
MVTDEERDYMYRAYANENHMRINLGIRRRLAPLLGNDRRKIELLNGLLFSMPGTPVLYYGDEIGMGDNFYLGDRNGVRTPMQWNADRNAGFSQANTQRLYLPVISDPEYRFEAINVENQQNTPHSLLWWMIHLIAMHKRNKLFGRGSLEFLQPENRKVLVFIRRYQDECILVVANLSRFAQCVEIDLSAYKDFTPLELSGRLRFPPITEHPYLLTLNAHAFLWFALEPQREDIALASDLALPMIEVQGAWPNVFRNRAKVLLERLLPNYLVRRWFAGKARTIQSVEILKTIPLPRDQPAAYLTLFKVTYTDGEPETYVLPLAFAPEERAPAARDSHVATLQVQNGPQTQTGILHDAMSNTDFASVLLSLIARNRRMAGESGDVVGQASRAFRPLLRSAKELEPTILRAEQSNTSIIYGDLFILKLFRRVDEGINPDLEIGRDFTDERNFPHIAPVAGALEVPAAK